MSGCASRGVIQEQTYTALETAHHSHHIKGYFC